MSIGSICYGAIIVCGTIVICSCLIWATVYIVAGIIKSIFKKHND